MTEYRYEALPIGLTGVASQKVNQFLNAAAEEGWKVQQIVPDTGFQYVLLVRE